MIEKKDFYTYPAIITWYEDDENGFDIEFIDFENCVTCPENKDTISKYAIDRLQLEIFDYEEENRELPKPTHPKDIKLKHNQYIQLFEVYMPIFRKEINESRVKKNCTIPFWLNELAVKENINFSRVLVDGLKRELKDKIIVRE